MQQAGQGVEKRRGRNLRKFLFSTFPQPFFQHVDKAVETILEHEDEERYSFLKLELGSVESHDAGDRQKYFVNGDNAKCGTELHSCSCGCIPRWDSRRYLSEKVNVGAVTPR